MYTPYIYIYIYIHTYMYLSMCLSGAPSDSGFQGSIGRIQSGPYLRRGSPQRYEVACYMFR